MNPTQLDRLRALRDDNDITAAHMAANAPRFEAYRTRHEDGTGPRIVTAYQLFQTPAAVAARMVALAGILPHHRVLEPSAGLGRILLQVMAKAPAHVTACEMSPDCCRELYRKYPAVELWQGDFLNRTPGEPFDRVVMNPPFHRRIDLRHIFHALTFLRPGGVLVGLCMDTHHRETALFKLADLWDQLPAGTFRAEGTDTATVLFRITV